jgi:hypothetical protein
MGRRHRRSVINTLARGRRFGSPGRFFSYQITTRGLYGDSRAWRSVWYVVTVGGLLRRTFGKRPEVAAIEVLQPGEKVSLRTIPAPSRRERRAAKQEARRAARQQ